MKIQVKAYEEVKVHPFLIASIVTKGKEIEWIDGIPYIVTMINKDES